MIYGNLIPFHILSALCSISLSIYSVSLSLTIWRKRPDFRLRSICCLLMKLRLLRFFADSCIQTMLLAFSCNLFLKNDLGVCQALIPFCVRVFKSFVLWLLLDANPLMLLVGLTDLLIKPMTNFTIFIIMAAMMQMLNPLAKQLVVCILTLTVFRITARSNHKLFAIYKAIVVIGF